MDTALTPEPSAKDAGKNVSHRWKHSLTNRLEQDHRGIKQRSSPMRGFGSFPSAARFCRAFDEGRPLFRFPTTMKQRISFSQQREFFRQRWMTLLALGEAAEQSEGEGEMWQPVGCFLGSQF